MKRTSLFLFIMAVPLLLCWYRILLFTNFCKITRKLDSKVNKKGFVTSLSRNLFLIPFLFIVFLLLHIQPRKSLLKPSSFFDHLEAYP